MSGPIKDAQRRAGEWPLVNGGPAAEAAKWGLASPVPAVATMARHLRDALGEADRLRERNAGLVRACKAADAWERCRGACGDEAREDAENEMGSLGWDYLRGGPDHFVARLRREALEAAGEGCGS